MKMSRVVMLLLFAVIFILGGCVSQSAVLKGDAELTEDKGYIYGNFESANIKSSGAIALRDTLRLVVENKETLQMYTFLCGPSSERLKVVEVVPGSYIVKSIQAIQKNSMAGSSVKVSEDIKYDWYNLEFEVAPNTAVYLGDFLSESDKRTGVKNWYFPAPTDSFVLTTEQVKEKYPAFVSNATTFTSNIEIPIPDYYVHIFELKDVLTQEEFEKYGENFTLFDNK